MSGETKHTKGPWHVNGCSAYGWRIGNFQEMGKGDAVANPIALVAPLDDFSPRVFPKGCGWGNARLIASAPEMYRMLEAAVHCLRSYQFGNAAPKLAEEMADACEVVIREARGESSL
jgi:hypothetical protein